MSQSAIAALFKPDSSQTLITLLTIYDPNNETTVLTRLADNYTQRLNDLSTEPDIIYGVRRTENSVQTDYVFLPMQITLPSEEQNTAPRCSIVLTDVTRYIIPIIRNLKGPPKVKLELVLNTSVSTPEVIFDKLYISSFSYDANQVTAELSMIDYAVEPFPAYNFTPKQFPGLF
jgi:hypothetical protein